MTILGAQSEGVLLPVDDESMFLEQGPGIAFRSADIDRSGGGDNLVILPPLTGSHILVVCSQTQELAMEPLPPIELQAPDISPYRNGNTGVDYVTTMYSGRPGPHAMILAIMHGNELCGPVALDFLFRRNVRPRCGKLTLGFANVEASRNRSDRHVPKFS